MKDVDYSNGLSTQMPPEVQIEVPSDSDSSRRPSKYTISNTSSMYDMQRRRSCAGGYAGDNYPGEGYLGDAYSADPVDQNVTSPKGRRPPNSPSSSKYKKVQLKKGSSKINFRFRKEDGFPCIKTMLSRKLCTFYALFPSKSQSAHCRLK